MDSHSQATVVNAATVPLLTPQVVGHFSHVEQYTSFGLSTSVSSDIRPKLEEHFLAARHGDKQAIPSRLSPIIQQDDSGLLLYSLFREWCLRGELPSSTPITPVDQPEGSSVQMKSFQNHDTLPCGVPRISGLPPPGPLTMLLEDMGQYRKLTYPRSRHKWAKGILGIASTLGLTAPESVGVAPVVFAEGTGDVATSPRDRQPSQEQLTAGGSTTDPEVAREPTDHEPLSADGDPVMSEEALKTAISNSNIDPKLSDEMSWSPKAVSSTTLVSGSQLPVEQMVKGSPEKQELTKFASLYREQWRELEQAIVKATTAASDAHSKAHALPRASILPSTLFDEVATRTAEYLGYLYQVYFLRSKEALLFSRIAKNMLGPRATMPAHDDQFTRLGCIGKGSYSHVYACRKNDTGKLYAMKVAFKRKLKFKKAIHSSIRELIVMSRIDSPFVTGLRYAYETEEEAVMVIDFLQRGDLERFLLQFPGRRFPEHVARFYAAEIVLALKHLHSRGIVHRDLKASNILVGEDGHIRLADFGLAVFLHTCDLDGESQPEGVKKQPTRCCLGCRQQYLIRTTKSKSDSGETVRQAPLHLKARGLDSTTPLGVKATLAQAVEAAKASKSAMGWAQNVQGTSLGLIQGKPGVSSPSSRSLRVHAPLSTDDDDDINFELQDPFLPPRKTCSDVCTFPMHCVCGHDCQFDVGWHRGRAGTPGYWAPEMLRYEGEEKKEIYGVGCDWWSFGCVLYALMYGRSPFPTSNDNSQDKYVMTHQRPIFVPEVFSEESADLITQLLSPDQSKRLGCGPRGWLEVMRHPFFDGVDWDLLERGLIPAPCKPTYRIPLDSLTPPPKTSKPKKNQMEDPSQFTERLNKVERRMFTHFWFVDQNTLQMEIMENISANRRNFLEEAGSKCPRGSSAHKKSGSFDADGAVKGAAQESVVQSTDSTSIPIHFNSFEDNGHHSTTSGGQKSFHFRNSSHLRPLLPPLAAIYCSIHRNIVPLTAREWLAATASGLKGAITLVAELGGSRLGRQAIDVLRGTSLVRAAYTGPNDLSLDIGFLLLDAIMQDCPGSFFEAFDPAEVHGNVSYKDFYREGKGVIGRGGYWGVVIPDGMWVSTVNSSLVSNAVFTPSPTRALIHRVYSSRPSEPTWNKSVQEMLFASSEESGNSHKSGKGGGGGGGGRSSLKAVTETREDAPSHTTNRSPSHVKIDHSPRRGYGTMDKSGGTPRGASHDVGAGIMPGAEHHPARSVSRNSWKLQGGGSDREHQRHGRSSGKKPKGHTCCTIM